MTTYEKIKILCEKEGFSISSMPQKIPGLSISKASITGWKNGSVPRPEKLKLIAEYFGVSPEHRGIEPLTSRLRTLRSPS